MRRRERAGVTQNRLPGKLFLSVREKYLQSQTDAHYHHGGGVDPRLPPEGKLFFGRHPPHCSQNLGLELRRCFILLHRGNKESSECLTFLQERLTRGADGQMLL